MKTTWPRVVALSAALLAAQVAVSAHHSFAAEFDATKPVTLTGTVATIAWTNPHAHIHLDVKDQGGKVTSWDFELGTVDRPPKIAFRFTLAKPFLAFRLAFRSS